MPQSGLIAALYFAAAIAMAGMPPLSGFLGKLLILDAARADAAIVWPAILVTSLLTIVGLARGGQHAVLETPRQRAPAQASQPTRHPHRASPSSRSACCCALLVALTFFAGPVTAWLQATTAALQAPAAYIAANAPAGGG